MKPLRYGSVCSGIEAASVAWEPLGWEPAWFCEIDPFASALLAHRFPRVPNHGDFTRLLDSAHPVHESPIDILVGGTPCQDFSVAGLRAGVEGDRGSLTLDFCRLVGVLRPKWVVWENVPGVLSSDGGRALGAFLGALAELGYGFAYRVLDARYFGLAQRRKRVFVVGCAGAESSRAGAVLLEPESVRGDPPARRKARKEAPADAGGRAAEPVGAVAFNGYARTVGEIATPLMAEDYTKVEIGVLVPGREVTITRKDKDSAPSEVSPPLSADADRGDQDTLVFTSDGLVADPISANEGKTYTHEGNTFRMYNCVSQSPTLSFKAGQSEAAGGTFVTDEFSPTLQAQNNGSTAVPSVLQATTMAVRRLTPRECERLQGFPDDWTLIPYRKGESSDSNRYRALGNSMAVPVMRWIGTQIARVEEEGG